MLDTYDFSIQHRPGRLHCNDDGLPRRLSNNCIIPVRTIERFNSAESGSRNSVDGNSSNPDSEIRPNWLDTWTDDQLRT